MNPPLTPRNRSALPTDVMLELAQFGDAWTPRWTACTNAMKDCDGNQVSVHDQGETLRVKFEHARGNQVEVLDLDPLLGAARIARIIDTLAAAP